MKTLYFDLQAGCSGDMILGALLDLGADFERLQQGLAALALEGYTLERGETVKGGIRATRFTVHLTPREGLVAETAPVHSHAGSHPHAHARPHAHPESSSASPDNAAHSPRNHAHRTFAGIRDLLSGASLPAGVRDRALAIFTRLAEAEGRIHGVPPDAVQFHEVGAVDSIVDITGIALALADLSVEAFACSAANVGTGTVSCAHGVLPVPAPATAELLRGFPVYSAHFDGELITPTGAAVLQTLVANPGRLPAGVLQSTGYGAGSRELPGGANVLRVLLLEEGPPASETDEISVLECNLDDMNPEWVGDLAGRLMEAGALDVFHTAIQMKKFRPGVLLTVLCRPSREDFFNEMLLALSTTFGVRRHRCLRTELERRTVRLSTALGPVTVKAGFRNGRLLKVSPEYEDCRKAAETAGRPVAEVYRAAERAIADNWEALAAPHGGARDPAVARALRARGTGAGKS